MEDDSLWAAAIAISGNQIQAVLSDDSSADAYIGPDTQVIDLDGSFVLPGFIDGHTHFDSAGALLNDANLLKVSDGQSLRQELGRVVGIIGPGEWITADSAEGGISF